MAGPGYTGAGFFMVAIDREHTACREQLGT